MPECALVVPLQSGVCFIQGCIISGIMLLHNGLTVPCYSIVGRKLQAALHFYVTTLFSCPPSTLPGFQTMATSGMDPTKPNEQNDTENTVYQTQGLHRWMIKASPLLPHQLHQLIQRWALTFRWIYPKCHSSNITHFLVHFYQIKLVLCAPCSTSLLA